MAEVTPHNLYPKLTVSHIQKPRRFWAIPIFGFVMKAIILLPVWIWLAILMLVNFLLNIINSFAVLLTGEYMDVAYELNLGILRLGTRTSLFLFGLTDKYPGFGLSNGDPSIHLEIEKPKKPNRYLAIPLAGGFVRFVLLIPYFIFIQVIGMATWIGTTISSFWVFFQGRYPESTYELTWDYLRVYSAALCYITGISDKYPSFWISMNHQTIKLLLIIAGSLYFVSDIGAKFSRTSYFRPY